MVMVGTFASAEHLHLHPRLLSLGLYLSREMRELSDDDTCLIVAVVTQQVRRANPCDGARQQAAEVTI